MSGKTTGKQNSESHLIREERMQKKTEGVVRKMGFRQKKLDKGH